MRVTEFVDTNRKNAPDGPGGVTDDTTLAHYISLAIIARLLPGEAGGRADDGPGLHQSDHR
jgi:hypothetical protein